MSKKIVRIYHGGAANNGSGGSGYIQFNRFYDQAGNLLLEGRRTTYSFIEIKTDAYFEAVTDFDLETAQDLIYRVGRDYDVDITNDSNVDIGNDSNLDIGNDYNITTAAGAINQTAETDLNLTANNGDVNIAAAVSGQVGIYSANKIDLTSTTGITASGIKSGISQVAAGAVAGEFWWNSADTTLHMGV